MHFLSCEEIKTFNQSINQSVFAEPDPEPHIGLQIQRVVKFGEDQLVRMFIVQNRHGVPQS